MKQLLIDLKWTTILAISTSILVILFFLFLDIFIDVDYTKLDGLIFVYLIFCIWDILTYIIRKIKGK